jgi:hypothetical protein
MEERKNGRTKRKERRSERRNRKEQQCRQFNIRKRSLQTYY